MFLRFVERERFLEGRDEKRSEQWISGTVSLLTGRTLEDVEECVCHVVSPNEKRPLTPRDAE